MFLPWVSSRSGPKNIVLLGRRLGVETSRSKRLKKDPLGFSVRVNRDPKSLINNDREVKRESSQGYIYYVIHQLYRYPLYRDLLVSIIGRSQVFFES